jgi:hypothetical protein
MNFRLPIFFALWKFLNTQTPNPGPALGDGARNGVTVSTSSDAAATAPGSSLLDTASGEAPHLVKPRGGWSSLAASGPSYAPPVLRSSCRFLVTVLSLYLISGDVAVTTTGATSSLSVAQARRSGGGRCEQRVGKRAAAAAGDLFPTHCALVVVVAFVAADGWWWNAAFGAGKGVAAENRGGRMVGAAVPCGISSCFFLQVAFLRETLFFLKKILLPCNVCHGYKLWDASILKKKKLWDASILKKKTLRRF